MSITEQIAEYVREGESSRHTLGVEVEHFVLDRDNRPVPFETISNLIQTIGEEYHWPLDIVDGHVIGLKADLYAISLEPACQLEISIDPFESIDEIRDAYRQFVGLWSPRLDLLGYRLVNHGQHPDVESGLCDPDVYPLIEKKRYEYMDQYLRERGNYGRYMMRASASTQVSIDFSSEADLRKKLAVATLLAPILALDMENSTAEHVFSREKSHLLRLQEWQDLDPDRTGFIPGSLSSSFGYLGYAEELYHRPLLVLTHDGVTENAGSLSLFDYTDPEGKAFRRELLDENGQISQKLIEHTISMFFFHIRVKRFLEIRVADCVPENRVLRFAALIKGIFYHEENLDKLTEELGTVTQTQQVDRAFEEIFREGRNAVIYNDRTAAEWIGYITDLAAEGLSEEERKYLI